MRKFPQEVAGAAGGLVMVLSAPRNRSLDGSPHGDHNCCHPYGSEVANNRHMRPCGWCRMVSAENLCGASGQCSDTLIQRFGSALPGIANPLRCCRLDQQIQSWRAWRICRI